MLKQLFLVALVMICGCKSTDSKSSGVKSTETVQRVSVSQDSVTLLARCGGPDAPCERDNKWRSIGIRYIANTPQSAEGAGSQMDHYFRGVYVAEQSSKMFGKVSELNMGEIHQMGGLVAYGSSVFSPIVGDWEKLIFIGKLDDNANLVLEPGISVVPAVNDVRQNLWERYWKGLSDERLPFLYLTYDKNQKYAVATLSMMRDNIPPK